jgi:Tol biopolymer transport system component
MTLPAGARLGPYEILAPIGAGGMGEVYRAKDPRLGRDVAIKVLPSSFSSDPDRLKRFEQEARAAGVLNHPNITIVYDIGTQDGAPYVVQELLEGETLRSELAGGRFSPRKAIDYANQIAQGLAAAHEKGIVHRDLKPENLFVTKDGRVKILDFGLAKLTQVEGSPSLATSLPTATEPGVVMGTLGYMSPEQVKGRPADARSDIFSFGAILYEMLSGKRPFHADSAGETMAAILKEDPPDLSSSNQSISPGLERIVRHCLEKNPERRVHSAHDLAFELDTISSLSGPGPASPASGISARRWRVPLIAAAAALLGLAAGALVTRASARPQSPTYRMLTFRKGTVLDAFFAPDGQTVVYSAAWEGAPPHLFSTRPGGTESRSLGLPDGEILSMSSAGDLAIGLGPRDPLSAIPLARVPLAGGAPRPILDRVRFADWSPDGKDLAVVREIEGADHLEYPIGKTIYVEPSDHYLRLARVSPDGKEIGIVDTAVNSVGEVAVVDLSGHHRTLAGGFTEVSGLVWRPDGRELWLSAAKESGNFSLYAVSTSGRVRLVRQEASNLDLMDVARDGRILINSRRSAGGLMVRLPGSTDERDVSWLDDSGSPVLSPDARTLVFTEGGRGGGKGGSVYLRNLGAAANDAVRLGDGSALALSPDGEWVLSSPPNGTNFVLLPSGAGQPKEIEVGDLGLTFRAGFFPDGKRVYFKASAPGRPLRLYQTSLSGGHPAAISPEGVEEGAIRLSPDGSTVAAPGPGRVLLLYPTDGSAPRALHGAAVGEEPIQWSKDGRSLWVCRPNQLPVRVYRVEVATGQRDAWHDLAPVDPGGALAVTWVDITPDGSAYAYQVIRMFSTLYVAEGLR